MTLNFQPIDISMKPMVESYTKPWGLKNSEYTFTSLLIWGYGGRIVAAEHEGALYLFFRYAKTPFMYAPLPAPGADYARALAIADEYFAQQGIAPLYKGVSGELITQFGLSGKQLTPDRDNFDYIYAMEDLKNLSGKRFHGKRNHINQFMSAYEYEYVPLGQDARDECIGVYQSWLEDKDVNQPGILGEYLAIKMLFEHMQPLGVYAAGVRIGGKLSAFTMGERMNEDTALIHIEKADGGIQGLYAVMNQQFVEHRFSDMKYINREEDMGIEGLRRAKLSYNPVLLLEKYEAR